MKVNKKLLLLLSIMLLITFTVLNAVATQKPVDPPDAVMKQLGVHGNIYGPVLPPDPIIVYPPSTGGTTYRSVTVFLNNKDGNPKVTIHTQAINGFYNTGLLPYSPADYPTVTVFYGHVSRMANYTGETRVDFHFDSLINLSILTLGQACLSKLIV